MLDFSDATKLQTRDGRDVRDVVRDRDIICASITVNGCSWEYHYDLNGRITPGVSHPLDLIPKPAPPRTGECWLNVYAGKRGSLIVWDHCTLDEALKAGTEAGNCIGRIRVELVEGRFDS